MKNRAFLRNAADGKDFPQAATVFFTENTGDLPLILVYFAVEIFWKKIYSNIGMVSEQIFAREILNEEARHEKYHSGDDRA